MVSLSMDQADILIVDDTPANLSVLSAMLSQKGYEVRPAISGEVALKAAHNRPPDLILLDIRMPDMNGYAVCDQLKRDERTCDIPVIFISALDDIEDKMKAFQMGGVDYITKPFHMEEVLARVESQLMLLWQRKEIIALSMLKDRMIHMISHDLETPINNLKQCLQSLKDTEKSDNLLFQADQTLEKMHKLVSNLLELSEVQTNSNLELTPILLKDLLNTQLENCRPAATQKHLTLEFLPPPNAFMLNLDPKRIAQAIDCLLRNAIRYTPAGGSISLSTQLDDDWAIIQVRDTGLGIPAEDLPILFDSLYRVENQEHRALREFGLGLSIAKAIVEQHRGQIWAESDPSEGNIFHVALPIEE